MNKCNTEFAPMHLHRRTFLGSMVAAGVALSTRNLLGAAPATAAAPALMPARLCFGGPVRMGSTVQIAVACRLLGIHTLDFTDEKGHMRIDVGYQFTEGRKDGGAEFKLQLFSKEGERIAEETVSEKRIRDRRLYLGHGTVLADEPNRIGEAEFRFHASVEDAAHFYLEVTESR